MAKKAIVALVVVFILYALVTEPQRSMVRDATRGILGGAQVAAESVLAFFDELV